jgi:hypothetical protein
MHHHVQCVPPVLLVAGMHEGMLLYIPLLSTTDMEYIMSLDASP